MSDFHRPRSGGGTRPAQVALEWLLAHAPNILLLTGTADVNHLAENVAIESIRLDQEAMGTRDALASA